MKNLPKIGANCRNFWSGNISWRMLIIKDGSKWPYRISTMIAVEQRFLERILPWASKAHRSKTNQKRLTGEGHKCDGTIYKNVVQLVLLNFPLTKKNTTENVKMLEFLSKSLGE